jgi:protein TonB
MGHGRDIEPRVHPPREVHLPRRPVQRPELPELAAHEVSVAAPASVAVHGAEVESPPRIAFNPAPAYPPDALAAGATGLVELRVRVAADGRVLAVALHRTSGHASLDRAALEAVRQWRFHPAQRDGVATQHEVIVPVRFRLRQ